MDQRALFLRQVKLIVEKHGFILVPRVQSMSFMAERGMTENDLKRVILSSMGRNRTEILATRRSGPWRSSRRSMRERRCT